MNQIKVYALNLLKVTTILLLSFGFAHSEYPNTSIGVIDLNLILTDSKAAKSAAEQIEAIAKNIEDEIKKSDDEIIEKQNELIESQSIMAPEAFEIKRQEYEKEVQNYNKQRQEKLLSIDKLLADSRNKVLDTLKPILEEISNEKGITILLEKNIILLNAEKMDITEDALKQLNEVLPKLEVSEQ
tara:strand:- start:721 stop:1275 length:555 start_codon:yes stop_codon:yes gene_type:complete